jgi:hypothetical protein
VLLRHSLPENQKYGSQKIDNRQVQNKDTIRFVEKGFSSRKQDIDDQRISQQGNDDDQ